MVEEEEAAAAMAVAVMAAAETAVADCHLMVVVTAQRPLLQLQLTEATAISQQRPDGGAICGCTLQEATSLCASKRYTEDGEWEWDGANALDCA